MSADAKIWQDEKGNFHGIHDGPCGLKHEVTEYDLLELLEDIQHCLCDGNSMRWSFRAYPEGFVGLVGFA